MNSVKISDAISLKCLISFSPQVAFIREQCDCINVSACNQKYLGILFEPSIFSLGHYYGLDLECSPKSSVESMSTGQNDPEVGLLGNDGS